MIKIKNICILSHSQFETFTRDEYVDDFVAIVIYSHGKNMPYIEDNPAICDILFEQFNDVDDSEEGMNIDHAARIAKFVQKHADDEIDFVVSCQYGESRSAGVAAALAAYFGQDEMSIFANPNKLPNMHCYVLTCQAFGIERSEKEIRARFLVNAQATSKSTC